MLLILYSICKLSYQQAFKMCCWSRLPPFSVNYRQSCSSLHLGIVCLIVRMLCRSGTFYTQPMVLSFWPYCFIDIMLFHHEVPFSFPYSLRTSHMFVLSPSIPPRRSARQEIPFLIQFPPLPSGCLSLSRLFGRRSFDHL